MDQPICTILSHAPVSVPALSRCAHFYKSVKSNEGVWGLDYKFSLLFHRMECYNCITDTLAYLLSASVSHPHAPSVPKSPGPPPQPDPNRMTTYDAEKHVSHVQHSAVIQTCTLCFDI